MQDELGMFKITMSFELYYNIEYIYIYYILMTKSQKQNQKQIILFTPIIKWENSKNIIFSSTRIIYIKNTHNLIRDISSE